MERVGTTSGVEAGARHLRLFFTGTSMPFTVFLVEDDPVIEASLRLMMSEVLDAHVVGSAQTADDAVAWLAGHREPLEVIVLDLFLKVGTGFTVLSHMSAAQRRCCVVLTNSATPAKIALCRELGAAAVFDKTLQIDEFMHHCARLPGAGISL